MRRTAFQAMVWNVILFCNDGFESDCQKRMFQTFTS